MALSKIDAVNFLTGTIPSGNIATSSLAAAATGKVLQVVQGTTSTPVDHSTSSYADTGLSASITPSSSSNKVLVMVQQHCFVSGNNGGSVKILRGSTAIYTPVETYGISADGLSIDFRNYHSFSYLDSPSSTSALTFKTQARAYNITFKTQPNSFTSFITLMEIVG